MPTQEQTYTHHAGPTAEADDRLTAYLRSLPQRQLAADGVVRAAERLWERLRDALPGIVVPNCVPTEEGGLRFSWIHEGRYLDAEIAADGRYEWFFRDRAAGLTEDGAQPTVEIVSPQFLSHLRTLNS
jgi:hypothetical protein